MGKEARSLKKMGYEELQAEIQRTEAYLDELKKRHQVLSLDEKVKDLRRELDELLAKKRELGGEPAAPKAPARSRQRRRRAQTRADAKAIYKVIAKGDGLTKAEIRAALPEVKLPNDLTGTLAKLGLVVKGSGPKRQYRYRAVK